VERDPDLFGELLLMFQDAIAFTFFEILLLVAEASKHGLSLNAQYIPYQPLFPNGCPK